MCFRQCTVVSYWSIYRISKSRVTIWPVGYSATLLKQFISWGCGRCHSSVNKKGTHGAVLCIELSPQTWLDIEIYVYQRKQGQCLNCSFLAQGCPLSVFIHSVTCTARGTCERKTEAQRQIKRNRLMRWNGIDFSATI